jgi:hypothetical protein
MSLNRLPSFVPFDNPPDPQSQDSDRPASSGAFMISFSLNLLSAVWVLMLLVSAAALIVFAWFTSGVAYFGTTDARDAEIQAINSINDIGVLQHKAVFDVSHGYENGATATFLCHIALGTLLVILIGSIASLLLIRWIKRHLRTGG